MAETIQEIIERVGQQPRVLELSGNHRYQPKSLMPYFGYDNMVQFQIDVEWALWNVQAKIGAMPAEAAFFLTDGLRQLLRDEITTTLQDEVERGITKHDIRALIKIIQELVPKTISQLTHIPATSYDIIDTARVVAYKRAFWEVVFPALLKLISSLKDKVVDLSDVVQIGRTHGQHAEPITVGFWLATILARIIDVAKHLIERETELTGKFSGAVGACNSQVAFKLEQKSKEMYGATFEELVLAELGLRPGLISSQILLPEPLARFLFELTLLSAAMGQISRDCRNLQRTELAEIVEPFTETQAGSSAMPHKRNPINWEGIEGIHAIVKDEFHKVQDTLISEHQRDGTGMCVMREFPGIIVLTQHQLETINKIVPNMRVDAGALKRNFDTSRRVILSEAIYIALVMAGYEDDAHSLVNHVLVPRAQAKNTYLVDELGLLAQERPELRPVANRIPSDLLSLFYHPEEFTGKAREKALAVAKEAGKFLEKYRKE